MFNYYNFYALKFERFGIFIFLQVWPLEIFKYLIKLILSALKFLLFLQSAQIWKIYIKFKF